MHRVINQILEFIKSGQAQRQDKVLVTFLNHLQLIKEDLVSDKPEVVQAAIQRLDDKLADAIAECSVELEERSESENLQAEVKRLRHFAVEIKEKKLNEDEVNLLLRGLTQLESGFSTARKPEKKRPLVVQTIIFAIPLIIGYFISEYAQRVNKLKLASTEIVNPVNIYAHDGDQFRVSDQYKSDLTQSMNEYYSDDYTNAASSYGDLFFFR